MRCLAMVLTIRVCGWAASVCACIPHVNARDMTDYTPMHWACCSWPKAVICAQGHRW